MFYKVNKQKKFYIILKNDVKELTQNMKKYLKDFGEFSTIFKIKTCGEENYAKIKRI